MISYFTRVKGSSTAEWADDKFYTLIRNKEIILLTSIGSNYEKSNKIYKSPSISLSDYIEELRLINSSNRSLSITQFLFLPFSIVIGGIFDLFLRIILKGHGESKWSWFILSVFYAIFIFIKHKPKYVFTTGGPAPSHLIGIILKIIFNCKLVNELQDPLVGNNIGRNVNSSKYLQYIENLIIKYSDKVVFVSKEAAKEANARHQKKNIEYIYPGSINRFVENKKPLNNHSQKLKIIHMGTAYGSRNYDNLFKAIDELLDERKISINDFEITNLGEIYCDNLKEYFKKEYFTKKNIVNRDRAYEELLKNNVLLLLQHTDERSKITIPYKFYDYLNSNKKIFALINSEELEKMIENTDHVTANNKSIPDIKNNFMKLIGNQMINDVKKSINFDIKDQVKKLFIF